MTTTTPLVRVDTTVNTDVKYSKVFALAFVKIEGVTAGVFTEDQLRAFVIPKLSDATLFGSAIVQLDSLATGHNYHSGKGDETFTGLLTKVFSNGIDESNPTADDLSAGIDVYFVTMDGVNETAMRSVKGQFIRLTPKFMSDTVVAENYNSEYGWETNVGWECYSNGHLSNQLPWRLFDKSVDTPVSAITNWHSSNRTLATDPAIVTIKYPVECTVKRYRLTTRQFTDGTSFTWSPRNWKLQGSNDNLTWTDIGDEQIVADAWLPLIRKEFDVSFNSVAYTHFRLRITRSIQHHSILDDYGSYVAIEEWELETVQ